MVGAVLLCCVRDCQRPLSPLPWGACPLEVLGGWMLGWRGKTQPALVSWECGQPDAALCPVPSATESRGPQGVTCKPASSLHPMEISGREQMVANNHDHGFARLP